MDQAVLDSLKRYYRKKLMRTALSELNEERSMIEVKKSITVRDAIHWAAEAWSNISSYTLLSSWNNLLPEEKCTMEVPEFTASEDEDEEFTLKNWLDSSFDEPDPGLQLMNDEEILEFCKEEKALVEEPVEEVIYTPHLLPISEAALLLQDIVYALENDVNGTKEEVLMFQRVLNRWRK